MAQPNPLVQLLDMLSRRSWKMGEVQLFSLSALLDILNQISQQFHAVHIDASALNWTTLITGVLVILRYAQKLILAMKLNVPANVLEALSDLTGDALPAVVPNPTASKPVVTPAVTDTGSVTLAPSESVDQPPIARFAPADAVVQ